MGKHKRTRAVEATISHRKTMDRMLDRKLQVPMAKVWDKENKLMRASIARHLQGRSRTDATPADVKAAERIARAHAIRMGKMFGGYLQATTRETQTEGIRSLASFMGTLKPGGSQLDQQRVLQEILAKGQAELKERRKEAAAKMAASMYSSIKGSLNEYKLEGKKVKDLIDHVHEVADKQWWQVQRTMRTETSAAFNLAQANAFHGLKDEFPGILQRWTELINDLTGLPMDNRVAKDSMLMHGQVARPGHVFTMPAGDIPATMVGKTWLYPPNRPNDRAVLTPWFRGWKVPAWEYYGGVRITLA